jgi:hypothetical protein
MPFLNLHKEWMKVASAPSSCQYLVLSLVLILATLIDTFVGWPYEQVFTGIG